MPASGDPLERFRKLLEGQPALVNPHSLVHVRELGSGAFGVVDSCRIPSTVLGQTSHRARASRASKDTSSPDRSSRPSREKKDGSTKGSVEEVAVKRFHQSVMQDPTLCHLVCNEVEIMLECDHPNIVAAHSIGCMQGGKEDVAAAMETFFLVQDLVNGLHLRKVVIKAMIDATRLVYRRRDALRWLIQLAAALKYLHAKTPKVCHRDVKLENILLTGPDPYTADIRLADLGLAVKLPGFAIQEATRPNNVARRSTLERSWSQHLAHESMRAPGSPSIALMGQVKNPSGSKSGKGLDSQDSTTHGTIAPAILKTEVHEHLTGVPEGRSFVPPEDIQSATDIRTRGSADATPQPAAARIPSVAEDGTQQQGPSETSSRDVKDSSASPFARLDQQDQLRAVCMSPSEDPGKAPRATHSPHESNVAMTGPAQLSSPQGSIPLPVIRTPPAPQPISAPLPPPRQNSNPSRRGKDVSFSGASVDGTPGRTSASQLSQPRSSPSFLAKFSANGVAASFHARQPSYAQHVRLVRESTNGVVPEQPRKEPSIHVTARQRMNYITLDHEASMQEMGTERANSMSDGGERFNALPEYGGTWHSQQGLYARMFAGEPGTEGSNDSVDRRSTTLGTGSYAAPPLGSAAAGSQFLPGYVPRPGSTADLVAAGGTRQEADGSVRGGPKASHSVHFSGQTLPGGSRVAGERARFTGDGTKHGADGTRHGGDGTRHGGDGTRHGGDGTRHGVSISGGSITARLLNSITPGGRMTRTNTVNLEARALQGQTFDLTGGTGSFMYMAPEIFKSLPYNEKADVFSFAICMYELLHMTLLLTGVLSAVPRGRDTEAAIREWAAAVAAGYRPPLDSHLPPSLLSLLQRCWSTNPLERPTMEQVHAELEACLQKDGAALDLLDKSKTSCGCCTIS